MEATAAMAKLGRAMAQVEAQEPLAHPVRAAQVEEKAGMGATTKAVAVMEPLAEIAVEAEELGPVVEAIVMTQALAEVPEPGSAMAQMVSVEVEVPFRAVSG